jgi:hypothetical protein
VELIAGHRSISLEGKSVNRVLLQVFIAAVVGVLIIVVPTWFFLEQAGPRGMLSEHYSGRLPLLRDFEKEDVEAVSVREVGVFGLSLAGALAVYVSIRVKRARE